MASYILCPLLWVLLCLILPLKAQIVHRGQSYHDWLKKPSAELLDMGNSFSHRSMLQDSAMVCYRIIAERYTDKMPREDKEMTVMALNEMGVLNSNYYCNHKEAYQELLMARDICEEIGLERMKPYILLNLGNLYNLYEFLFPPIDQPPQAGDFYEQSFRAACRLHLWDMAINSYINFTMLNMPYGVGDGSVHREMATWLQDSIPNSVADWQLASHFLKGNVALLDGHADQARRHYGQMMDLLGDDEDMVREQYMVYTCIEATYLAEQRYDSAIVCANQILQLQSRQDITDIQAETYRFLAEYYDKLGNEEQTIHFHTAYLETKEQLMKNIVGLVPTQLSRDLQAVGAEIGKMKERGRMQTIGFFVAVVIIVLLVVLAVFIEGKNRQLSEKNRALYRQMREIIHVRKVAPEVQKYRESQLKEEKKQELVEQIMAVMSDTGLICQPTFTLQLLAERVGSNTSYVSRTINELFGMTFTSMLNQYRVREACRRMEDQETYGHLTIDAISESVGFKTRVTFTKSFKQNVGMLPSEYLRAARQESTPFPEEG